MSASKYNVELNRGTGLIQETLVLLDLYQLGMTKQDLTKKAIEGDVLVKSLNKRIKDIVEVAFYKRYVNEDPFVPLYLKSLLDKYSSLDVIAQLFLIYTARANSILMDFIIQVYWPEVRKGTNNLDFKLARQFIGETIKYTNKINGWSEITQKRVASYIISTLVDFRFLDKERNVKPVFLQDITANYLAHELHFKGLSDIALVEADEWKLFGHHKQDVIQHLERISFQGHFIFQNSGEIIKITWHHQNMTDFINAIE